MSKLRKSLLIGVGALLLSTVAIQASDMVRGISGNLAGLAVESVGVCGAGATQILLGSHSLCVDIFEASPSDVCPYQRIENQNQTQDNANNISCQTVSKKDAHPWRFVSLTQSQQFCARSGKRLPTNEEWYKIISGFGDQSECVTNSGASEPNTTGSAKCQTPSGVFDMVGNVWEWIDAEVQNGSYNSRALPQSGYVSLVDTDGIVIETAQEGKDEFGDDYAQTNTTGIFGIVRGGFYGSKEDAGIFAQNLAVPLDLKSAGVGFRCVRDM